MLRTPQCLGHRPYRSAFLSLLSAALLAGCGGGSTDPAPDVFAARVATETGQNQASEGSLTLRRQRLDVAARAVPTVSDDEFFDWVERQLPEHFPTGPRTQVIETELLSFRARYYESTGNYVGTVRGGAVYGLGPYTGGELTRFGTVESYACDVAPGRCGPAAPAVKGVWTLAGSRQCLPASGTALLDVRRQLGDAGVRVVAASCSTLGAVADTCGFPDVRIWMFNIDARDEGIALKLGFYGAGGLNSEFAEGGVKAWSSAFVNGGHRPCSDY